MISRVLAYLFGTVFGEVMLMAWWWRSQTPALATFAGYITAKKGEAVLSGALAVVCCLAWAEGSLATWLGWSIETTLGMSVMVGALVTFFAHGVLALVSGRIGVAPPKD